jgi:LmbE family N-acetylglucosaminyl deacetylase
MTSERLQDERDLIPYAAEGVLPAARVLVVAPHPDDEVFGCGGCARLHAMAGAVVEVVVLTDGAGAGDPSVRERESREACALLGLGIPSFWAFRDRELGRDKSAMMRLVAQVEHTLAMHGTDLVYAPSPWEVHPDHRAAARAVAQAVAQRRQIGASLRWAAYEVGSPLWPQRLVNIDEVLDDKRRAMNCFASQLAFQPYHEHVLALNRYRSYTVSGQCQAAEALWLPGDDELQRVIGDWDQGFLHRSQGTR